MRAGVARSRASFLVLQGTFRLVTAGWHLDRIAARVHFAGFIVGFGHLRGYPADTGVNRDDSRVPPRSISTATSPNAATTAKK
ncbi:hypothetical protein SAMN05421837_102872 [Amycolatopsis pretoriensis]|uniref:Uncharacterized protein n=1 Tax=Amycolatopsis pretoriensis TaxID=218821 RepID=A0A1H5QF83_9PSEU|nr:hypothetical protein SAMN05421837_102872 [Amycolatopsis pretoriensis]